MWECLFIRQRPAAHLVTAQDGGVGSGQGVRGEESQGGGGAGWMGPQARPLGCAQPAHSSSFSSSAGAGMSPHVRDHCLKCGLLVWLKRPFMKINTDESQTCCVRFPKVMFCRTGYVLGTINLPILYRRKTLLQRHSQLLVFAHRAWNWTLPKCVVTTEYKNLSFVRKSNITSNYLFPVLVIIFPYLHNVHNSKHYPVQGKCRNSYHEYG